MHLLCCYNFSSDKKLLEIIRLLLKKGIDVNAQTRTTFTALHFACRNNCTENLEEIVKMLLDHDADPTITNADRWNALHYLARFYTGDNLLEIIKIFLKDMKRGLYLLKERNSIGVTATELLLQNSSGQFHAIFDYFFKIRKRSIFRSNWRAETVIDLSKTGCAPMVNWFAR